MDRNATIAGIIFAVLGAVGLIGSLHEAFTDGKVALMGPLLGSVGFLGLGIAFLVLAYLEDKKKAC